MSALGIIAMKTLDTCKFYFKKSPLIVSNIEVKVKLFITTVRDIELNFRLLPEQANLLYDWNVFPGVDISDDFIELRLRLKGSKELCKILNEKYKEDQDTNPAEILLNTKNENNEFVFRDFENYSPVFSMLVEPNSASIKYGDSWKWEWYNPEEESKK